MNAYHYDDTGLLAHDPKKRKPLDDKGGKGNGAGLLSPFMPGDQSALAQQLSFGFGGAPEKYRKFLGQTYSGLPMPQFRFGVKSGNGAGVTPKTPVTVDQKGNVILPPPTSGENPYISYYRQFGAAPMGMR